MKRNRKLQKNSKKIQKIKKYHYGFILSQNRLGTDEEERIKIIVPFRSYPTRNRKFQKKKKIRKLKDTITATFRAKIGWKRPRMCENKSYHSVSFLPDVKYKISKK